MYIYFLQGPCHGWKCFNMCAMRLKQKSGSIKNVILHTLTRWVWVQGIELSSKADGWGDCFQCLLGKWLKCTAHVNKRTQWGKCEQRLAADSFLTVVGLIFKIYLCCLNYDLHFTIISQHQQFILEYLDQNVAQTDQ